MSGSPSDRNSLEELWRRRVEDVGLRLDFARTFVEEVQKDLAAGAVPAADGTFSYRRALRAQNVAAVEFGRVLLIYADLVVNGKPPDEGDGSHTRRVSRVRLPNSPVHPFLARSLFLDEVYIAPKRGVPGPPDGGCYPLGPAWVCGMQPAFGS